MSGVPALVIAGPGTNRDRDLAFALELAGAEVTIALVDELVERPELVDEISAVFGAQCCVVAIDARSSTDSPSGFEVFTHGGRTATGIDAIEWAREVVRRGAGEILLTSMDRDGTRDGYDLVLTSSVARVVGVPVIASGGVGVLDHLVEGVNDGGADAVLAASIFHYGEHTVAEAKEAMAAAGIVVRPPDQRQSGIGGQP